MITRLPSSYYSLDIDTSRAIRESKGNLIDHARDSWIPTIPHDRSAT